MAEKHTLKGDFASRRVWLDGREITPVRSQTYWNHSPDGFNWGYAGSGQAQIALAVCMELSDEQHDCKRCYQQFKFDVIARCQGDFEIEFDMSKYDEDAKNEAGKTRSV